MIDLKFDKNGLIPAIVQDYKTRQVLILAYMNKESLKKTLDTGLVTFFSRSRQTLWTKGETSGNYLHLVNIDYDCDEDALLVEVDPVGPACHTGQTSCFYRTLYTEDTKASGNMSILTQIEKTIDDRTEHPDAESYTNYLLTQGIDKICKKVGEEATETVIAAKNHNKQEIAAEAGDLIYHLMVLLKEEDMTLKDVFEILQERHGKKSEIKTQGKAKRGDI